MELRLWPGTLWAAFSDSPTQYSSVQPCMSYIDGLSLYLNRLIAIDPSLPPSVLIPDIVRRSPVAHLFHFYTVLCEISSIPRQTPSIWMLSPPISPPPVCARIKANTEAPSIDGVCKEVTIVDARGLAKECLKVLGRELGAI